MALSIFFVLIVLVNFVIAVRISPKLDFGDSQEPSHLPIRINQGPNYGDSGVVSSFREVSCTSNDCSLTKNSDSASATADVVVHVKTAVNVPKNENVPDVPIIVGTKDVPSHFPIDRNPVYGPNFDPNYGNPGFNVVNREPLPIGRTFPNYPRHIGGHFGNRGNSYGPEFQWYPNRGLDNAHNPHEFTKIYKNTWTSDFPNDWSGYTNKRHTLGNYDFQSALSKWTEFLGINKNLNIN